MYNVLICDDDTAVIELLVKRIDWKAYNMQIAGVASNGVIGLDIFEKKKIDIVLADIKMPVLNGLDMAAKMREKDKHIKIIFLTSSDDVKHAIKALTIKAEGYILKPFTLNDITNILRNTKSILDSDGQQSTAEEADGDREREAMLVEVINKYIDEHIGEKITVNSISEHIGYSPNHTGQIYKMHTGKFINERIVEVKMKLAVQMLDVPVNSVPEIAERLGYNDYTYFLRQFKQYYGITPKAYRSNKR